MTGSSQQPDPSLSSVATWIGASAVLLAIGYTIAAWVPSLVQLLDNAWRDLMLRAAGL